jgi:anti-anti-sigma factor
MLHGSDGIGPDSTPCEPPDDGTRFLMSLPVPTRPGTISDLEPFAVEVQRRDHVTIVRPCGELDMATVETLRTTLDVAVETLRAALDGPETGACLVLDLRRLSFIDSTGLHLVVALDERAQRDGFPLALIAPAAPIDRGIQLCGLDQVLPFVPADHALDHAIAAGLGRDAARAARSANRGT